MKQNREFQKEILETLAKAYPETQTFSFIKARYTENNTEIQKSKEVIANLCYLGEHGLVENTEHNSVGTINISSKITAKGLDFLADDGGLSAILGVVTIKIHDDTLRELIEMKIMASDLSQPDKKKWTDALRELPAESIKHLTMTILDKGLENLPVILPLIGKCLFS